MMHYLRAIASDGEIRPAHLSHSPEPPWTVKVSVVGGSAYSGEGADLFEALSRARQEMERDSLLLCCNGARRNARPSPAQSGEGANVVYLLPTYRLLTVRDVFPLFAPAPPESVASVNEQTEYYVSKLQQRKFLIQWVNPLSWIKLLNAAVKGPRVWIPELSSDGFVEWTEKRVRDAR